MSLIRSVAATILLLIILSCSKEDLVPTRVVYGKPDLPMVFNLKVFDPNISSKSITIDGFSNGFARLEANNNFLIYEPGLGFENDQVDIHSNGSTIARVIFFSEDINEDCNALARSYSLEVKKNSTSLSFNAFVTFCFLDVPSGRIVSATEINPSTSLNIAVGGGAFQISYIPPADFVGLNEFIYEVGAASKSVSEIYEADYLVSGLIQINVVE